MGKHEKFYNCCTYLNLCKYVITVLVFRKKKWKWKDNKEMVFCYQNCSSDRENLLKFETEGREFANFLRSLEQFIQTMKGQNNSW